MSQCFLFWSVNRCLEPADKITIRGLNNRGNPGVFIVASGVVDVRGEPLELVAVIVHRGDVAG